MNLKNYLFLLVLLLAAGARAQPLAEAAYTKTAFELMEKPVIAVRPVNHTGEKENIPRATSAKCRSKRPDENYSFPARTQFFKVQ